MSFLKSSLVSLCDGGSTGGAIIDEAEVEAEADSGGERNSSERANSSIRRCLLSFFPFQGDFKGLTVFLRHRGASWLGKVASFCGPVGRSVKVRK